LKSRLRKRPSKIELILGLYFASNWNKKKTLIPEIIVIFSAQRVQNSRFFVQNLRLCSQAMFRFGRELLHVENASEELKERCVARFVARCVAYYEKQMDFLQHSVWTFLLCWKLLKGDKDSGRIIARMVWEDPEYQMVENPFVLAEFLDPIDHSDTPIAPIAPIAPITPPPPKI
jgi:hypothetical protein